MIEETLSTLPPQPVHSFESLGEADAEARRVAGELVAERAAAYGAPDRPEAPRLLTESHPRLPH